MQKPSAEKSGVKVLIILGWLLYAASYLEKVNSGLIAGVLNGFCYVGSATSSYGLGAIADHFDWTAVFWTLMGFCAIACAIWGVYMILKRIWKEEKTA